MGTVELAEIKRNIKKIACVGEVMIELIAAPDGSAALGVAGDTFNTAVYLARALGEADARISYVTALGTDPYSARIVGAIEGHGIDTSYLERREGTMPGLYAIDTDEHGERSFSYWRSTSAARTLFATPCKIELAKLGEFDLVYFSGISMAILRPEIRTDILAWIDRFRKQGGVFAYDSNYRPQLWESTEIARRINSEIWRRTDIALPSIDDEMALFGDSNQAGVLARLASYGVSRGALKRGKDGPVNLATGTNLDGLPKPEKVVDSTAAGDSFNAGYLAAFISGQSDDEAIRAGHALAIKVIAQKGAILPS